MTINPDKKKMLTVILKADYERLEAEAKKQMRSVSNLSLLYILEGLKRDENAVKNTDENPVKDTNKNADEGTAENADS